MPDRPTGEPAGPGVALDDPGDARAAAGADRSPGLRLSARVAQVAAREAATSAPEEGNSRDGADGGSTGGGGAGGGRSGGGQGPRPPASWRRTLYALWFAQILALIAFSMRAPFLPYFLGDLGLEDTDDQIWWSTVITAAGAVCMAVTAPIWGILSDRVGRKPMVIRAMLFATFTIGLMSIATAPWQVLGLRLVEGAFTGTVTACAALVAATVPRDRVGFGLGLIQTSVFSGSSLGPLFGGFLAGQIGYRWTFFTASLFMAAGVVIVLLLVEERFQPVRRVASAGRAAGFRGPLAILAIPVVGIMVVTMLVSRGTSMALQPILPLYVAELGGMGLNDAETAGLILGAQGLTSAIASIYFGRLGDRIGHRRILTVCTFAAGFIYLPMAIATQSWQLLFLQAVFGVAAGGLVPTANALVANATDPRQRGVVFGLMAGAGSLGAFVGPLAVAGLTTSGGFGLAFLAIGLSLLLTGIAIVYTFNHRARELPGAGRPVPGD